MLSCLAAALSSAPLAAAARPGTLDTSFGVRGRSFIGLGPTIGESRFGAVVAQPDGKLLVEGERESGSTYGTEAMVERRNPDGSLDPSFGKEGELILADAEGLALQPDGRILFGESNPIRKCRGGLGAVRRLNPDGSIDRDFGDEGCGAPLPFEISGIAVDGAGRIVVAGDVSHGPYVHDVTPARELVLARLQPDGSIDASFGDAGIVRAHAALGLEIHEASGLALNGDGSVFVAGNQLLLRFGPDGKLDGGFGAGGKVEVAGSASGLLALPEGKIALASRSPTNDFVVSRYLADGTPDPAFGKAGAATVDVSKHDEPAAIGSTPDGGFLLAGDVSLPDGRGCLDCEYTAVLVRFTASGALDAGYGNDGVADVGPPPGMEKQLYPAVAALATTASGGAVVAGDKSYGGDAYLIARAANGEADRGFGRDGSLAELRELPSNTEPSGIVSRADGELIVDASTNARSRDVGGRVLLGFGSGGKPRLSGGSGSEAATWSAPIGGPIGTDGRHALFGIEERRRGYVLRFDDRGRVDRRYGSNGKASLPLDFRIGNFLVRPDGSVTLVGRIGKRRGMAIYRIDARGRPDRRFGSDGLTMITFGNSYAEARALVVQADGRIVVAGAARGRAAAARLLPDGSLDQSFGHHGRASSLLGSRTAADIVVRQGRGTLIACEPEVIGQPEATTLVRLDGRGRSVSSFGRRGVLRPGGNVEPFALFATRRGSVLITKRGWNSSGGIRLRAYRRDGTIDRGFGHHGITVAGADQKHFYFTPVSVVRQPNGKIVVAGTAEVGLTGYKVELLRFNL